MSGNPERFSRLLIDLQDVWAGYEADTVLEQVTFKLYEGDFVGSTKPNGGGKTTLIKVILGLVEPHAVK